MNDDDFMTTGFAKYGTDMIRANAVETDVAAYLADNVIHSFISFIYLLRITSTNKTVCNAM